MRSASLKFHESVKSVHSDSLAGLTRLAAQIRATAAQLDGFELLLGQENIGYINQGAESIQELLEDLADDSNSHPLVDREIRHDLRNQLAAVKGFADLMLMGILDNHPAEPILRRLSSLSSEFSRVLDDIKTVAEDMAMAG